MSPALTLISDLRDYLPAFTRRVAMAETGFVPAAVEAHHLARDLKLLIDRVLADIPLPPGVEVPAGEFRPNPAAHSERTDEQARACRDAIAAIPASLLRP